MTMFIFICLFAFTCAEPPVGDGYPPARSHDHHHGVDLQRSLSQEYTPYSPEFGARSQKDHASVNTRSQSSYIPSTRMELSQEYGPPAQSISQEYGVPNLRSGLSQEYGPPASRALAQEYGAPTSRSLSQEYGLPASRSLSQEYGPPSSRSLSQEYGVPSARLSQQYGVPTSRNAIDTEYGTPSARSQNYPSTRLSQEYGVPQLRSGPQDYKTIGDFPSDSYGTPLQRSPSTTYGQPDFRSTPSEEYSAPAQRSFGQSSRQYSQSGLRNVQSFGPASQSSIVAARQNKPLTSSRSFQNTFGVKTSPQSSSAFRTPSTQYIPSTRNSDSYSSSHKSVSQTYLPSSRTVSQTYGVPNERSLSSEYGAPESRTALKTDTFASSYDTARSAPASKYGVPSVRDSMPSEQYGVPEQYDSLSNQGYNYARNALDELLNQEPANYDFGYKVNDFESGSDFGHSETRQENKAEGSYFVVLPDGTKQTVEYEADERGFKPRISVEQVDKAGYDDNAADITRSADGPY